MKIIPTGHNYDKPETWDSTTNHNGNFPSLLHPGSKSKWQQPQLPCSLKGFRGEFIKILVPTREGRPLRIPFELSLLAWTEAEK